MVRFLLIKLRVFPVNQSTPSFTFFVQIVYPTDFTMQYLKYSFFALFLSLVATEGLCAQGIEAHFPGCDESDRINLLDCAELKMKQFIFSNLSYPAEAKAAGVTGNVDVSFTVGTDGSLKDIKIVSGLGHGCDKEVSRILGLMPKWVPGTDDAGQVVEEPYELSVLFKNH